MVEPSQAAKVKRSPPAEAAVRDSTSRWFPVRPTVPCAGWETTRSVSASPSASLATERDRHRRVGAVVDATASATTGAWLGLAISLLGPRGRCSSRSGSRARTSWCRTSLERCGRPARATAPCRGSRCRGRRGTRASPPSSATSPWLLTQACRSGACRAGRRSTVRRLRRRGRPCTRRARRRVPGAAMLWTLSLAMRSRELGVRRAVAGLALEAAVAGREAVERQARRRRVGVGREGRVDGRAHVAARRRTPTCSGSAPLLWIAVPVWQLWQRRLVEPAGARRRADVAHRAVAALALHRQRAVGGDRRAHRAAQAARLRAGMAAVAGGAVGRRRRASGR